MCGYFERELLRKFNINEIWAQSIHKGLTSLFNPKSLIQNLKAMSLWIFTLVWCSIILFLLNVKLRLTLKFPTSLKYTERIPNILFYILLNIFSLLKIEDCLKTVFLFWIVEFNFIFNFKCLFRSLDYLIIKLFYSGLHYFSISFSLYKIKRFFSYNHFMNT